MKRIRWAGLAAAVLTAMLVTASPSLAQDFPAKPIKVIVPTNAGGGMDHAARVLQRYLDESGALNGQKLAVVNMPGAGGTVGTRAIREAEPDGYTIGLWHEGLITSKAMGIVDYDHEDFAVLGIAGYADLGLATGKDNAIDSFKQLLETAKAKPNTVLVATNVGLGVHFVPLMMQSKAGVELKYVQVGGGAKRFPSVVAGHTDIAIFGTAEMTRWADAGLWPLVLFAEKRSPVLPDVPTAKESGIDLIARSYRIWVAPKGTPADRVAYLSGKLKEAIGSDQAQKAFKDGGLVPAFLPPAEAAAVLAEWKANATPLVSKARELQK
jgi:tripartite-type tricarboxylate transporter receptor subunit TctC